jgi:hypothetical protein
VLDVTAIHVEVIPCPRLPRDNSKKRPAAGNRVPRQRAADQVIARLRATSPGQAEQPAVTHH